MSTRNQQRNQRPGGHQGGRVLHFEALTVEGAVRILSDPFHLADDDKTRTVETLTRVTRFDDPFYGEVDITRSKLQSMVKNFDDNVYGQEIPINIAHMDYLGKAGTVRKLAIDRGRLRGTIDWTPWGIKQVQEKGFAYFSMEMHEDYKNPESGAKHGPTLLGAALTIRPRVKHLDKATMALSFDAQELKDNSLIVPPYAARHLSEEIQTMWQELMKKLKKQLSEKHKLGDTHIKVLTEGFEKAVTNLTEEDAATALMESVLAQGAALAQMFADGKADPAQPIQLSINAPAGGLSAEDVKKLMAEQAQADAAAAAERQRTLDGKVKAFTEKVTGCEAFKHLSEADKQDSLDASLITADMNDDQVAKFAEMQISHVTKLAARNALAAHGFGGVPGGSPQISVDHRNEVQQFAEDVRTGLRNSREFRSGKLALADPNEFPGSAQVKLFVQEVVAAFDTLNERQLYMEAKAFAAGTTGIADTSLPKGFERQVILEALHDLRVLELVTPMVDLTAKHVMEIPYEVRDVSQVTNDGQVFEGQPIHRASVEQKMDMAYVTPTKLAFLISNEVMHFSRTAQINWEAWGRSVASNSRFVRELIVRRICNEIQRSSDASAATAVSNETLDAQMTGAKSQFKTVNFPVIRPHQVRDVKGTAIGSETNPITVRINGVTINRYDGTGTQTPGTYYKIVNLNLGIFAWVDESGAALTPTSTAGADDISYSYTTNVVLFDTDDPGTDLGKHLDGLLGAVGDQKAVLADDRFVMADFLLMSHTVNNTCTKADQFKSQDLKKGTDLQARGDLEAIKGLPAFATNTPCDLGDNRIQIGQAGNTTYGIAKPFETGQPFENVDSNGKPTGQKQAYGEEYNALHTPAPVANRANAVIPYSATARAAI